MKTSGPSLHAKDGQAFAEFPRSSRFTPMISSLIDTVPSPSQSPTHAEKAGVGVGDGVRGNAGVASQ
jgi:hypothetical protein